MPLFLTGLGQATILDLLICKTEIISLKRFFNFLFEREAAHKQGKRQKEMEKQAPC